MKKRNNGHKRTEGVVGNTVNKKKSRGEPWKISRLLNEADKMKKLKQVCVPFQLMRAIKGHYKFGTSRRFGSRYLNADKDDPKFRISRNPVKEACGSPFDQISLTNVHRLLGPEAALAALRGIFRVNMGASSAITTPRASVRASGQTWNV